MTMRQAPQASGAPIQVLLADDHHITLWGLQQFLQSVEPPIAVLGHATTAVELMQHPALGQTDVVVLDLGLSQRNSLDCVRSLVRNAKVQVVVLTGSTDPISHREAVRAGARGIVVKSHPAHDIADAIYAVHAGGVWLDTPLIADASMVATTQPSPSHTPIPSNQATHRIASLTPKERDVIQALVKYQGAKALVLAEALQMSENTLRNHLTVIYSKLGIRGKLNLYVFARQHGLAPEVPADQDSNP